MAARQKWISANGNEFHVSENEGSTVTLSIIADWCGPFGSVDAARKAALSNHLGEVLYLATGKKPYQRSPIMQYVGISNNPTGRFTTQHHVLHDVTREFQMWIGLIASQRTAGRRSASHPVSHSLAVDRAEWTLAYFLELPLNERKRSKPPPEEVVLLSRWFKSDFLTRRVHRGHEDWPDFIEYSPHGGVTQLQWFGGRRRRLSYGDIAALAKLRLS